MMATPLMFPKPGTAVSRLRTGTQGLQTARRSKRDPMIQVCARGGQRGHGLVQELEGGRLILAQW